MSWQTALANTVVYPIDLYKFVYADGATEKYYTSFDQSVTFDGDTYTPLGITRTSVEKTNDLSVSQVKISVVCDDTYFDMDNIRNAGQLDNCAVYIYTVDSSDVANYRLTFKGKIAEVSIGNVEMEIIVNSFTNELRRPACRRQFSVGCTHVFCDARCGLTIGDWDETGTAEAGSDASTIVDAANRTEADEYWEGGYVQMTSGDNNGLFMPVKTYVTGTVTLINSFPNAIAENDTYTIWPHCEGKFSKCDTIFSNTDNRLAFEYMPTMEEVVM